MMPRSRPPQIIAFGGCGVGDPWIDSRLFRYALAATHRERPRVLLLTTASGDADALLARLHRVYRRLGAETTHWRQGRNGSASGPDPRTCDLVHVEGGNAAYLLHHMRRSGLAPLLREAWESGVVLTGTSAGASCWFTRSIGASVFGAVDETSPIEEHDGLGILPQSICVHFDVSRERREAYVAAVRAGGGPGFGIDHDAGLHFIGTELHAVVSRRLGATASSLELRDGEVFATRLGATQLGRRSPRDLVACGASAFGRWLRRIRGVLALRPAASGADEKGM